MKGFPMNVFNIIWGFANSKLDEYPILLVFLFAFLIVVRYGIPSLYKWWKKNKKEEERIKKEEEKKEAGERELRDKTRYVILGIEKDMKDTTKTLCKIEKHQATMNGDFLRHVLDKDIHTSREELVSSKELDGLLGGIKSQISQGFTMLQEQIKRD